MLLIIISNQKEIMGNKHGCKECNCDSFELAKFYTIGVGAVVGGTIGSVVGPVGTVVGAFVGGKIAGEAFSELLDKLCKCGHYGRDHHHWVSTKHDIQNQEVSFIYILSRYAEYLIRAWLIALT